MRVGVVRGRGVDDTSASEITACIERFGDIGLRNVDLHRLQLDELMQLGTVVIPGGMAKTQASELGSVGRDVIREFVGRGGGYVGICAGAFLATKDRADYLGILDAQVREEVVPVEGWGEVSLRRRPAGAVSLTMTKAGVAMCGPSPNGQPVWYSGGPIFQVSAGHHARGIITLATYGSETFALNVQQGTMIGTPAMLKCRWGRGQVIAISPHLELSGSDEWRQQLVRLVLGSVTE